MADQDDTKKTERDKDILADEEFTGAHGDPAEGGPHQGLSGDVGDDAVTGHTGDDATLGDGADHRSAPDEAGSDRLAGAEALEEAAIGTGENRSFSGAGVGGRLLRDNENDLSSGIRGGVDASEGKGWTPG